MVKENEVTAVKEMLKGKGKDVNVVTVVTEVKGMVKENEVTAVKEMLKGKGKDVNVVIGENVNIVIDVKNERIAGIEKEIMGVQGLEKKMVKSSKKNSIMIMKKCMKLRASTMIHLKKNQ